MECQTMKMPVKTSIVALVASLGLPFVAIAEVPKSVELNSAQWAAADDAQDGASFTLAQADPGDGEVATRSEVESSSSGGGSESPIFFSLDYGIYSDYIWRFVNLSEYASEGREDLNHQLGIAVGGDLGDFGTITFGSWIEWYAGQDQLDAEEGGQNAQEIDYTFDWTYTIEAISTDVSWGLIFYTFPNNKAINSLEWYVALAHNDAWMWQGLFPDNEDGVLNPTFTLYHDIDAVGGVWMEFALSHEFEIFENFTLTPGWMVAIDAGYWEEEHFKFAGDQWSLVAAYDLFNALQVPEQYGSMSVAAEIYWNNPWGTLEDNGIADDTFWGGVSLSYSWGS